MTLRLSSGFATICASPTIRHSRPPPPTAARSPVSMCSRRPATGSSRMAARRRWWLHHSLASLTASLERRGIRLILKRGSAAKIVPRIARGPRRRAGRLEPALRTGRGSRRQDHGSAPPLEDRGAHLQGECPLRAGRCFEPLRRSRSASSPPSGAPPDSPANRARRSPRRIASSPRPPRSKATRSTPSTCCRWRPTGARACRRPGLPARPARRRASPPLSMARSTTMRARATCPATAGTSMLSPHLRFGEVSPFQAWQAAAAAAASTATGKFMAELGWREFAYHVLGQFPELAHPQPPSRIRPLPLAGGL